MVLRVRALAAKPDAPSLTPRTHVVEGGHWLGSQKGIHLNPFVNYTKECDLVTGSDTRVYCEDAKIHFLFEKPTPLLGKALQSILINSNSAPYCCVPTSPPQPPGVNPKIPGLLDCKPLERSPQEKNSRMCASVLTTCWQSHNCQDCGKSLS